MGNRHFHDFCLGLWVHCCCCEVIFDWSELCSTRSDIFLFNITAHEIFFGGKRKLKRRRKDHHSECLGNETDCFQTNQVHYMPSNEDILITEKAAPLSTCFY